MSVVYQCDNPACSLGAVGEPGHFTGGITSQQLHVLTGKAYEEIEEKGLAGEGVCPNCGQPGADTGHTHEPRGGVK